MLDMKIFVDIDSDERLCRRLSRDIKTRGRDLRGVIDQYTSHVKPSFDYYIAPTRVYADLIVPRGGENQVAIDLIVQHVKSQLDKNPKIRGAIGNAAILNGHLNGGPKKSVTQKRPENLHILPVTPQIRGLHTFIRNKDTQRDEFTFYSKRLIRLIIEYALSLMPYGEKVIDTPQGIRYVGKVCSSPEICGVSIYLSGNSLAFGKQ